MDTSDTITTNPNFSQHFCYQLCYFCCNWDFSVEFLNFAAAFFHGIQTIVTIALVSWLNTQPHGGALFGGGSFSVVRVVPVWHEAYIESVVTDSGSIDVRYVMIAFFGISALMQGLGGLLGGGWMSCLRFFEYSISASIMMMAIALEAGVRDLYTLECMFILIWATQLLGLISELLFVASFAVSASFDTTPLFSGAPTASAATAASRRGNFPFFIQQQSPIFSIFGNWIWLIPHITAWGTCLAAYGPVLDVFLESSARSVCTLSHMYFFYF